MTFFTEKRQQSGQITTELIRDSDSDDDFLEGNPNHQIGNMWKRPEKAAPAAVEEEKVVEDVKEKVDREEDEVDEVERQLAYLA
ncbi:hypothetical protein [Phaffia rhodozyma]|uniref:Uncharacterized protein n=1 Tax=Phaffia rhodozyma TaxID=264483 RepID=A0A0F7SLY0_PHARH|nr:hypothetical protein [Phaffia rhodozyma]